MLLTFQEGWKKKKKKGLKKNKLEGIKSTLFQNNDKASRLLLAAQHGNNK